MRKIFTLLVAVLCTLTIVNAQTNLWVSPLGDDFADGSNATPVRTIARAIALADDNGTHIFVATGNYTETQILELRSNLTIEGGFDADTWQPTLLPSIITVDAMESMGDYNQKIAFRSIDDTNWTLANLQIAVASATAADRATSGKGATVYCLYITGASNANQLINCQLFAGNGGDGLAGVNGINGNGGNSGSNGGDGGLSEWTNDGDDEGIGGSAVGSGMRAGGRGGNGSEGSITHSQGASAGQNGSVGGNGQGGNGGNGGAASSAGGNGGAGVNGGNGLDGTDGAAGHTHTWSNYYIPADQGVNGTDGLGGGGGGGGAGGGGATNYIFGIPGQYCGGAGGGGGSGGEGGTGGTAGTAGGGSFGIYCYNAFTPNILGTNIALGQGGRGGQGGIGGQGGAGGNGGSGGGRSSTGTAGNGGRGGNGGNGGRGGNGETGETGMNNQIAIVNGNQLLATDISRAIATSEYSYCSYDNIILTATPGFNGQTCRWYDSETGTTPLATDTIYIPTLTEDATFYVSTYNTTSDIESPERIAIHVSVSIGYMEEEFVTVCPSELPYIWNDEEYYTSGTHTIYVPMEGGCDSSVVLHLTVSQRYFVGDYAAVCENDLPYEWNGITFNEAGVQTVTLSTVDGCDSVVTMRLAVMPTYNEEETIEICESELPYMWNETEITEAGTQMVTFVSEGGCDSVVTLTVIVNPTYETTDTLEVASSELPYAWNGIFITTAGEQTVNLQSESGCDSIVTAVVVLTDGIDSYGEGGALRLYPNPTTGMVTIQSEANLAGAMLQVYDIYGRLLISEMMESESAVLDLSSQATGVYVVRIVESGRILQTARIVKR